jgi:ribonuclease R
MQKKILAFLREHPYNLFRQRDLVKRLKIRPQEREEFKRALAALVAAGKVRLRRGNRYAYPAPDREVEGRLVVTQKGFGFVITDDEEQDIFIGRRQLRDAIHGDRVRVRLYRQRNTDRRRGVITDIVKRGTDRFIGTVVRLDRSDWLVITPVSPERGIRIRKSSDLDVAPGEVVVAEVVDWGTARTPILVSVKSVIGAADDPQNDLRIILEKYDYRADFPPAVQAECHRFSEAVIREEKERRTDLRHLPTLTIDPAEARDFDDALSIDRTKDGYRLHVHIADVSHFVRPGSELDREARRRATSVYFTEGVVHMLPEALSADLCSLKPGVDRLALTARIDLDRQWRVTDFTVFPSVIRNDHRFTYREVQDVLEGRRKHPVQKKLQLLDQLSRALFRERSEWGSIDFDIPEPIFTLGEGGIPHEIRPSERLQSHRIVEECMLLANRLVAETFGKRNGEIVPFIYRIHDRPKPEDVEQFVDLLRRLRLPLSGDLDLTTSQGMRTLLADVTDSPYRNLIENLALRTMTKARYSASRRGHFGLAFRHYTHFTSPIRRYPDLIVHRLIKLHLTAAFPEETGRLEEDLQAAATIASEMEIKALEAEREYIKMKQLRWLNTQIGSIFPGIISGVVHYGFFVELEESLAEGLVHIDSLFDDEYVYDEDDYALKGRTFKRVYRLGDRVRIRVLSVTFDKMRANFALANELAGNRNR